MFPGQAPRVRCVGRVSNPNLPNPWEWPGRVRTEARAGVDRELGVNSISGVRRSQTREYVPPELSWSLSEVRSDTPAGYSQTPASPRNLARRRSGDGERAQPAAIGSRSRGREQEGLTLAVEAACGPRRSKRTPLPEGLSPNTHGSSNAPWVSHANACPRGGPVVPPRPHLDEFGKLLRWNGCGCWDVLRWCEPPIDHQLSLIHI